jgi:elongation factor P--beta-lysine ligase
VLQRPDVNVLARTRIELDGDVLVSLPQQNGKVKLDNEIIELHKENLEFHFKLWQQMVETMTKTLKDAADHFTKYVNPIGNEQNTIGNIFEDGFDIDLPSMEIG